MSATLADPTAVVVPPSSQFVFWPGAEPPMREEIAMRLADLGHAHGDPEDDPEDVLWSLRLDLAGRPASCLVWCEPIAGDPLRRLESVHWDDPDQLRQTHRCRWMIGVEGPLSLRDTVADYRLQLQLCDAVSRDWAPVVYDASSFQFRTRRQFRRLLDQEPVRTLALASVHRKVVADDGPEPTCWLHTHGLERAGIPDLELFDVPESQVAAACELFEAVADLWIAFTPPDPGTLVEIGSGLKISWRPWQAAAAVLPDDAVGGWNDRGEHEGHAGYRGVLTAADARRHEPFLCPRGVLAELSRPESRVYRTDVETRRASLLARQYWWMYGMLFAMRDGRGWRFLVKAGYPTTGGRREHLWFDTLRIEPGRVRGRLGSRPQGVPGLAAGQETWFGLDRLSDWCVVADDVAYGPDTIHLLDEANDL